MAPYRQPLPLYKQCTLYLSQVLNSVCLENKLASEIPSWESIVRLVQSYLPTSLQASIGDTIMEEHNKMQRSLHPSLVQLLLALRARKLSVGGTVVQSGVLDLADGSHLQELGLFYGGNGDKAARLHSFFQTASRLTHLHCIDFCNDDMVQIIANSCPNLYCIELRACDVTNDGILSLCGLTYSLTQCIEFLSKGITLEPLSRCSLSLREIKLTMTKVTEAGVAVILLTLKDINLLRVPDIRMEQVFNFLRSIDYNGIQINLKEFHSREMLDDVQLNVLTDVCPNLEYIQVSFLGNFEDDLKRLRELSRLKQLKGAKFADVDINALELFLQDVGKRMRRLHIYIFHGNSQDRARITRGQLHRLPSYCPNLEKLCIEGYCLEEDEHRLLGTNSHQATAEYFQSLKAFKVTSMKLAEDDLKIFLAKSSNMKELELHLLSPHALHDGLISELLDKGVWRNLEGMQVKNSTITSKVINRLLVECPYLHVLGCLSTWLVTNQQVLQIKDAVRVGNLAVDIY